MIDDAVSFACGFGNFIFLVLIVDIEDKQPTGINLLLVITEVPMPLDQWQRPDNLLGYKIFHGDGQSISIGGFEQ